MFKAIKEFFVGKPKEQPAVESAPYKVPEPIATTQIPLVVEPVVEAPAPVLAEVAPAPKADPAKKATAKKQQAKKNSAPRAPKAPK
jgi:hypothetical protein